MRIQLVDLDYEFTYPFMMKELSVPYFINNFHFHNDYELVYVIESTGTRLVGDHIGKFKDGDLVFIGPNLPHAWFNDKKYYECRDGLIARSIVTYFKRAWLQDIVFQFPGLEKLALLLENAARGVRITGSAATAASRLLLNSLNASGLKKSANIFHLLHELSEATEYESLAGLTYINQHSFNETKRMNEVYEFIIKNFSNPMKLEDVAAIAHMSPNAFCRYFKSQTQKTFSIFVNEIRIGHACKLLQSDQLTITQTGYECGFRSMTNFIKFFRKITGKTPMEYRTELRLAKR